MPVEPGMVYGVTMLRLLLFMLLLLPACAPRAGERLPRKGDEIMIAGQLFHTGTPVVLWRR